MSVYDESSPPVAGSPVSTAADGEDRAVEAALRPRDLDEIGRAHV